jgi:hypothetical protein
MMGKRDMIEAGGVRRIGVCLVLLVLAGTSVSTASAEDAESTGGAPGADQTAGADATSTNSEDAIPTAPASPRPLPDTTSERQEDASVAGAPASLADPSTESMGAPMPETSAFPPEARVAPEPPVRAEPDVSKPAGPSSPQKGDPPGWSIGVGASFFSYQLISMSATQSLGSTSFRWAPSALLLVERRLGRNLYLLFNAQGAFTSSRLNEPGEETPSKTGRIGGDVGIRSVFNPGGLVEVSGMVTVGGGWQFSDAYRDEYVNGEDYGLEDDHVKLRTRSSGYFVDGVLGIAFERELIPRLCLRLATSIVAVEFEKVRSRKQQIRAVDRYVEEPPSPLEMEIETEKTSVQGVTVGLSFSPVVQLRLAL